MAERARREEAESWNIRWGSTAEHRILTQDRPLGSQGDREDRSETGEQAEGKRAEPGSKSGGRSMSVHQVTNLGWGWAGRPVGRESAHIPEHGLARRASEAVGEGGRQGVGRLQVFD